MIKKSIVILVAAISLVLTCGCTRKVDLSPYVSQSRFDVLVGESENYSIKCYLENREKPLKSDGKKETVHPAVIVRLTIKNGGEKIESGVKVNFHTDADYSTSFTFHPESNVYVATCFVRSLPSGSLDVSVVKEDGNETVSLKSVVTDKTATPLAALELVGKTCGDLLKEEDFANGNFEVNVRLIEDDGSLYYFVGLITDKKTEAFLVSADGKTVIARKKINN